MIRAVVFDFDGVLVNSEPLHFQAFRDVAAEEGLPLSESSYYDKYLGFDDVGAFRAMSADAGLLWTDRLIASLVERKAAHLERLEHNVSVLFPGAREAILRMGARGAIAIASGALRREIERVLERENLRTLFPVLVAAEDTPTSKPDPAPYLRAVDLLRAQMAGGLSARDCVAIEDSRWGLQSANRAGLRTIGVTHSYDAADLADAETIIANLDMLTSELLQHFD